LSAAGSAGRGERQNEGKGGEIDGAQTTHGDPLLLDLTIIGRTCHPRICVEHALHLVHVMGAGAIRRRTVGIGRDLAAPDFPPPPP
jgi:hypothetical protein